MVSPTPTKNLNEKPSDILHRIANNDNTAVEQCLDVYGKLVWSIAKKYCNSNEDAEDATQDVFIDIWRNAGRFDAEKSAESTFIALIARRRLIDRVRKSYKRPQLLCADKILENQPTEEHKKLQMFVEVKEALQVLNNLKPQQKTIVQMAVFGGLSHNEISQITSLPIGTVKSQIRRGLQKIRHFLGG